MRCENRKCRTEITGAVTTKIGAIDPILRLADLSHYHPGCVPLEAPRAVAKIARPAYY